MRMSIRVWLAVAVCIATISPVLAGVADSPVSQPKPVMERVAIPAPYLSSLTSPNHAGAPGLALGALGGLRETETMLNSALSNAPRGKWLDLGTLGGACSVATSVNADGQVAGHAEVAKGDVHAFRWDQSSRAMLDLGTLGGKSSYAQGINDRGDVVGYSETSNGEVHAFVWLADQRSMRDLGSLGGSHSRATSINNAGQVVGYSQTADQVDHAFVWDVATNRMTDLGTLGGPCSYAYDISDRGLVVGHSQTADGAVKAFRWTADTQLTAAVDSLESLVSYAFGVSARGDVNGYSQADGGRYHGFAADVASGSRDRLRRFSRRFQSCLQPPSGWANCQLHGAAARAELCGTLESDDRSSAGSRRVRQWF